MILKTALFILGGYSFLFAFWKRLKEDYFENQIFSTGFYIFFFAAIGNVLAAYFLSEYWFWASIAGIILGIILGTWRFQLRFFEVIEAVVMASFLPLIMLLIYDGVMSKDASSFFTITVIALFIGVYYFINTRYKSFSWYKSGRVGFTGLAILGLFFLTRAIVAIWFPDVLSFVQRDWLLSGSLAFLTFLALINLTLRTS